jgi:hypothetical protein
MCCYRAEPEIIKILIENGAKINELDNNRNNALFYLIDSESQNKATSINLLVEKEINLNHLNSEKVRLLD